MSGTTRDAARTVNFLLSSSVAGGRTYYVSSAGNNTNPGTQDQPWATPGYGSRQLQAGDTLIILGGRYILSQYDIDAGTSTGAPSTDLDGNSRPKGNGYIDAYER